MSDPRDDKSHAAAVEFAATHFEQYGLSHLQIGHPWTGVTLADALRAFTPSHAIQNDATPQGDSAGESRSTLERAQGGQFAGNDAADKGKCGDSSVSRSAEHEPARVAPIFTPSATPCSREKELLDALAVSILGSDYGDRCHLDGPKWLQRNPHVRTPPAFVAWARERMGADYDPTFEHPITAAIPRDRRYGDDMTGPREPTWYEMLALTFLGVAIFIAVCAVPIALGLWARG